MQFHLTGTDPTPGARIVCRNSRWNMLVLLALFWSVPLFWYLIAAPWWVTTICTTLPLLLTWPLVSTWRKRGRRDNWVLAADEEGVWLNLRDCEYHEAAPAETVVFVPYSEIAAAQRVVYRYTTPSGDGGTTCHRDVFLEFQLTATDAGQLEQALAAERQRHPPERTHLGGVVTIRTRRSQTAVDIEGSDRVRVKFSSTTYFLRPSIKRVLAALRKFVAVAEDFHVQAPGWKQLDGAELDELVRRLAVGGQRIEAMKLLQRRRGMSTTEAKQHVDELCGRKGDKVAAGM